MKYLSHVYPDAAVRKRLCGLLSSIILMTALAGCASMRVFESCSTLPDRDNAEESLIRVQEFLRQDPQSLGCQRAQLLLRERLVAGYMRRAEQERQDGRWVNTQALYRRVLELQPGYNDAKAGLAMVERTERSLERVAQGRAAMRAQDWEQARSQFESALRLDVNQEEARQLLAEVARLSTPVKVDNGLATIYKKLISIEFRDMPIRMVFDAISKSSGLNFVFDKDIKTDQKVSIFLRDSTVESALYFLLLSNQLEQQVMNSNTILIYPNSPAKQKEYQELTVRTFQLINADAKTVAAALKTLFKGRDMVVDEKLNMITMRDTPEAVRAVEKLIALHDVAEPEVMLEVEILEVSRDKLQNLGVNLPDNISFSPLASGINGLTLSDLRNLDSSTIKVGVGATTINAKSTNSDVNTLANPRIRVVNREKAKVLIGERIPVVTTVVANTVSSQTVNYIDIGLKLDVEPIIYGGNEVVLKIALEVSSLGAKIGDYYTFGTRNANTTLRLRDGENQVLAGLIKDEDRRVDSKVPGIGEMPIVGRLFGTQQDSGNKTEIVLSITPRLTRRGNFADAASREFRSGTESSMRERPLPVEVAVVAPVAPISQVSPATQVTPVARATPSATLSAPSITPPPIPTPIATPTPTVSPAVTPTPLAQTPALKSEPAVVSAAPVPVAKPVVAAAPPPRPVEPAVPQPPLALPLTPQAPPPPSRPTPTERELANLAISALRNYKPAQQVNQPDTAITGNVRAVRNPLAPAQGGQ